MAKDNIQIIIDAVDRTKPAFDILHTRMVELTGQANILSGTFTKVFSAISTPAGASVTAIGAVAGAMLTLANKAAESAESFYKFSEQTGISIGNIQRLNYAAKATGTDMESVTRSITIFSSKLMDAAEGNEKLAFYLKQLGLEPKKALEDVYGSFIKAEKAMNDMRDDGAKTAILRDIFGRNARELALFSKYVIEHREELENLKVKTDEQILSGKEYMESLRKLSIEISRTTTSLGIELLPTITSVMNFIRERAIPDIKNLATALSGIAGIIYAPQLKLLELGAKAFGVPTGKGKGATGSWESPKKEADIYTPPDKEAKAKRDKELEERIKAGQEAADALKKAYDEIFEGEATDLGKSVKKWQDWARDIDALLYKSGMDYEQRQGMMVRVNAVSLQKITDAEIDAAQKAEHAWNEMEQGAADFREKKLQEKANLIAETKDIELKIKEFVAEQSKDEILILNTMKERITFETELQLIKKEGVALTDEEVQRNEKLLQLTKARLDAIDQEVAKKQRMSSGPGAMGQAWDDYSKQTSEYINSGKMMYDATMQTIGGMTDAVSGFFESWVSGSKSAGEAFKAFGQQVLQMIAQLIIKFIILAIVKRIAGAMGGGMSVGFDAEGHTGGLSTQSGFELHKGGTVRRFHVGNLASDEIPAILQTGEFILRRDAVKSIGVSSLQEMNKSGTVPIRQRGSPVVINMNITTKDAASFRKSKTQINSELARAMSSAQRRNV